MATNTVKVELIGTDKSLSKSFKSAAKDAHTFGGKLRLIGTFFKSLFKGDFKAAGAALKTLSTGFSGMAMAATAGIAAIIAAIGTLVVFLFKAKAAYEAWMTNLVKLQRLTGMSAKGVSLLAVQFRMTGIEAGKGQAALGLFAKAVDGARRGVAASLEPFKRLGVALKDGHGRLREVDDVLFDVRDALSRVKDPATRAGIAAKLFGRGFKDLLPWLTKSSDKIREYVKWTGELGLVMGKKSMDAFAQYRENQRKLSLGWDAIKINAFAALVPLINDLMPSIIKAVWKVSGWIGKFRKAVEQKGWDKALREMIPGFSKVSDAAKKAIDWLKENLPKAFAWLKENGPAIAESIKKVSQWLGKAGNSGSDVGRIFKTVRSVFSTLNPILGIAIGGFGGIRNILRRVWDAAKWVIGVLGDLKGVLSSGFNTGPLSAVYGAISSIISSAQTAYSWIQKVLGAKGNMSSGGGGGGGGGSFGGRALGGPVYASTAGDPYTLHGRETVVAHKDPSRGLQDLVDSGIIGDQTASAPIVNVYLDSEPIAARVEVRRKQKARRNARSLGLAPA